MKLLIWLLCGLVLSSFQVNAQNLVGTSENQSNDPPVIPVGLDAYRMWDQLHKQRIGERAYMISTYMREGGNRHADSRNFLWMGEREEFNVTLDVIGPGVLYFKRTPRQKNLWVVSGSGSAPRLMPASKVRGNRTNRRFRANNEAQNAVWRLLTVASRL